MELQSRNASAPGFNPEALLDGLIEANRLAEVLRIRRQTLNSMARNAVGGFPPEFKIGRRTFYNLAAVRNWISIQTGRDVDE